MADDPLGNRCAEAAARSSRELGGCTSRASFQGFSSRRFIHGRFHVSCSYTVYVRCAKRSHKNFRHARNMAPPTPRGSPRRPRTSPSGAMGPPFTLTEPRFARTFDPITNIHHNGRAQDGISDPGKYNIRLRPEQQHFNVERGNFNSPRRGYNGMQTSKRLALDRFSEPGSLYGSNAFGLVSPAVQKASLPRERGGPAASRQPTSATVMRRPLYKAIPRDSQTLHSTGTNFTLHNNAARMGYRVQARRPAPSVHWTNQMTSSPASSPAVTSR